MARSNGRGNPGQAARFAPGDLVCHRRYGYRGVVVDLDPCCEASDQWYQSNQTQPLRDQPWYHVLVDGDEATTYAAEDSLMPDPEPAPIRHVLIEMFFTGFEEGRYVRNNRPWELPW